MAPDGPDDVSGVALAGVGVIDRSRGGEPLQLGPLHALHGEHGAVDEADRDAVPKSTASKASSWRTTWSTCRRTAVRL